MDRKSTNQTTPDPLEWISATDAATRLQLGRKRVMLLAREDGITTQKAHPTAEPYYLRREIESWAELRGLRRQWLARHKEPCRHNRWTEKIDAETAERLFINSDEAAALLGVTRATVTNMVRFGRLVCYQTEPGRRGARLYFSRREVLRIAQDPDHIKRRESQRQRGTFDKANRQGRIPHARMVHEGIPQGWLTVREAAQQLGVSPNRVLAMRKSGHLEGQRIWRKNKPLRYWYFPDYEIERYLALRQEAQESRQAAQSATAPPAESFVPPAPPPKRASPFDDIGPEPKWACDDPVSRAAFFRYDSPDYD